MKENETETLNQPTNEINDLTEQAGRTHKSQNESHGGGLCAQRV